MAASLARRKEIIRTASVEYRNWEAFLRGRETEREFIDSSLRCENFGAMQPHELAELKIG